jgi:hypothetical protein
LTDRRHALAPARTVVGAGSAAGADATAAAGTPCGATLAEAPPPATVAPVGFVSTTVNGPVRPEGTVTVTGTEVSPAGIVTVPVPIIVPSGALIS